MQLHYALAFFPSMVSSRILDEARRLHISVEDLLGLPIKGKRPVTAVSSSAAPSTSDKDASSSTPPPVKRFRFGFNATKTMITIGGLRLRSRSLSHFIFKGSPYRIMPLRPTLEIGNSEAR